jgi:hypothetical protein
MLLIGRRQLDDSDKLPTKFSTMLLITRILRELQVLAELGP